MPMPTRTNRRTLLRGSTVACAGSLLSSLTSRVSRGDDGPFTLGIQLFSLRGYPVDEALRHAKALGFRAVEFYPGMFPIQSTEEQIAAMRKQLADLGLTISAHGVNGFGKDAAANRKVFEFAKAAGIRTITCDPAPEAFGSLDELVKEFDVRVAIHNHGPKSRYNRAIDVLRAIEGRDERIGACADLGHFIRSGERPVEVIRLLAGRLYGIHLKDFADMQEKTKGVILGKGHLDVPAVFAALEQAKFPRDGALSLEYEENPKNPLEDIRECVEVARSAMAAA
jgi:inosose dehydratase